MPTQLEYDVSKQSFRKLFAKIKLLNYNFQIVDELNGVVTNTPSFTIDSESDIRRSCSISLIPLDKSFDIQSGGKIWLDKYIQIYMGIEDIKTQEIIYTNMGIYLINNPNKVYSSSENTLSFECIDLMAKLTGMRNGYLEGMDYIIPAGSNVREVFIETLKLAGFNRYLIDECPFEVPNEIRISSGGTIYDILSQLRDIADDYQIYFDVDGIFHYNKIPTTADNNVIVANDDLWKSILINYNIDVDFQNVKNVIEIYGATHNVSYFGEATLSNSVLQLTIEGIPNYYDNLLIGFTTPIEGNLSQNNIQIKLNKLNNLKLIDENGKTPKLKNNTYYVMYYKTSPNPYFLFLSELTAKGLASDDNPKSPFYTKGTVGELRIVLQDGDYENLYSDLQCQSCAEYELYKRCKLYDSVTLTCVPIYWLDVNNVVEITLPNKNGIETKAQYLIKSISTSDTQSVELMRVYS